MDAYTACRLSFHVLENWLFLRCTEQIYRLTTNTRHIWNLMQCTLLCPLNIIRWFLTGLAMGRAVPSKKPQHRSSGAPFLCIASAKNAGSSHTKSRESRSWLNRVYRSSIISRKAIRILFQTRIKKAWFLREAMVNLKEILEIKEKLSAQNCLGQNPIGNWQDLNWLDSTPLFALSY